MIRFECDYGEGAHPRILKMLSETNLEQTPGYGTDEYCERARSYIRGLCSGKDVDVHFLIGGTQTNAAAVSWALRPYQGVISADSGHINGHETGAVEASGHKILSLPGNDGKISASAIKERCEAHWNEADHEHEVQPGMVYISQPTETGTLYSKAELTAISKVCRQYGLYLYIDGARLGYGIMSSVNDVTIADLASLCDMFYIGGTKQGMLFGEALVIVNDSLKPDFRYMIKQCGGMLAKGRLLGIQYCAMFEDSLYFDLSAHADRLAMKLRETFERLDFPLLHNSYTNQQFPIISDNILLELSKNYSFAYNKRIDNTHSAVRFCTSWTSLDENVDRLISDLSSLC